MRRQVRAVAVRPEETRNRFLMILAAIGVAVALFWSAAAHAQAGVPQGEDPPGMNDSNSGDGVTPPPEEGVITPPDVGDAEINQPPPDADPGTTPVIPPEQLPEQPKKDE